MKRFARPATEHRGGRASRVLLLVGAASASAAAVLGVLAFSGGGDRPLPDATEFLSAPPSTIPPRPPAVTATGPTPAPASPAITSPPLSPLAALLGEPGSAVPPAVEPRKRPRSITIGAIELWGPVQPVGLAPDGQLEVPDERHIGWYQYGAAPGQAGATVLAAHVTWNRTVGPFFLLRDLEPGDTVDVELDDGTTRTYVVSERTVYDKDDLPRDRIWRTDGDESLVLITCGGSFNPEIRRYLQNVVVYAVPVADSASA